MSIEDLIILGNEYLHKDEVKLILSTLLSMNPLELNLNLEKQVDEETVLKYKKVLKYMLTQSKKGGIIKKYLATDEEK